MLFNLESGGQKHDYVYGEQTNIALRHMSIKPDPTSRRYTNLALKKVNDILSEQVIEKTERERTEIKR